MPRIFDNIEQPLLPALQHTLATATHADFCVGFFNLRGWRTLADSVERFGGGEGQCCRLLIGMNETPDAELRAGLRTLDAVDGIDLQRAAALKRQVAEQFRAQLMLGAPTNSDEQTLRQLANQLRAGKVVVRLHLRYSLHAKLYLLYRPDFNNPITAFLGSSNLTMAGLRQQGELNVDVLEHPAPQTLQTWFNDRWNDRWSLDISSDLATVIDESWAREAVLPPYLVYLKMVYHLSQEARTGLSAWTLPHDFHGKLFPFQEAAVKIAAHHLNKRGGVLLGDVVGLGKTLMATAIARIFKDDRSWQPLIICPKNLVTMWESYNETWELGAKVVSVSVVQRVLPQLRRFRLVIIDESHTLRNRESKRYRAIQTYIQDNNSHVMLLSATPYNKSYLDLGAQLGLFVRDETDLGVRPELLIRAIGDAAFRRLQVPPRSLRAFEHSTFSDDWRELMRLYMVRRTRSFIKEHYAEHDPLNDRTFLHLADGSRFYFPERVPRTVHIPLDAATPDQYSRLYGADVVQTINELRLPRYGLANYLKANAAKLAHETEKPILDNLGRAGKRLMGFSRTNLFKRLESGGNVFLLSLQRHIIRNYIFLHALKHDLPLPIGTQDADLLTFDSDLDADSEAAQPDTSDTARLQPDTADAVTAIDPASYSERAAAIYATYAATPSRRFKWIRPTLFGPTLKRDLKADAEALAAIVRAAGPWQPAADLKLAQLVALLRERSADKVLIFSQFADTVEYLTTQLHAAGVAGVAAVTGQSPNPTALAHRFSPRSNEANVRPQDEIRVLIATDVLSEGQNLQDCHHVVNYDLPWAIIRLIQRAGRVDRIGQLAPTITCYTFLPADGIEHIIRLRARVRERLNQNREVVGTDEQFFDDGSEAQFLGNLYTERVGVLDDADDAEVDLASAAYQVWRNATAANPALKQQVERLPNVVYSAKTASANPNGLFQTPAGVLVFLRTVSGNDVMAWMDENGQSVTQSQAAILKAAECALDTPAVARAANHHDLVRTALRLTEHDVALVGGLGGARSARFRTYEVLRRYLMHLQQTAPLFIPADLSRVINDVYRYPLRQSATDAINRQLRSSISDEQLTELVIGLREREELSIIHTATSDEEPHIVCSLGLVG